MAGEQDGDGGAEAAEASADDYDLVLSMSGRDGGGRGISYMELAGRVSVLLLNYLRFRRRHGVGGAMGQECQCSSSADGQYGELAFKDKGV